MGPAGWATGRDRASLIGENLRHRQIKDDNVEIRMVIHQSDAFVGIARLQNRGVRTDLHQQGSQAVSQKRMVIHYQEFRGREPWMNVGPRQASLRS
jgi:hypothetical protein